MVLLVSQHTELELKLMKENNALKLCIAKLEKIVLQQAKQIKELQARLRAYENAHTPPSKSKKKREPKGSCGKLGAKKGHPKWEREQSEPTQTVEYSEDECPQCKHVLGKPSKTVRRVIEEIPKPRPIKVVEHLINHYECKHCGKKIVAKNNVPKGSFGVNAETTTVLLRFEDRLPLRKVVNALNRQGLNMTNVCVQKITNRIAKQLLPEYCKQILLLRASRVVYADETGIKIDGKGNWLWTFAAENTTVYVVRESRGHKVAEEVLGKKFPGVITNDGHTAYNKVGTKHQRCWAHIIRESKELLEKHKLYKCHHNNLSRIFKKLKEVKTKPPPFKQRLEIKKKLEKQVEQLCNALDGHKTYLEFSGKLRRAIPHLFTCIIHLFVEPTNNTAERALRELIVFRKIIGGLRRECGARTLETITSLLATWKQQGKPIHPTMKNLISR